MSILVAALLSASAVLPTCSWDRPGHNPFMGDVVQAVDRYRDIPQPVREKLKQRIKTRKYDDIAEITRDKIVGKSAYKDLRQMHFGPGTICNTITRTKWVPSQTERGLVYCEGSHCIIIPTVCRNVSRITKEEAPLEFETAAGPPPAPPPEPPVIDNSPLTFETAAGIAAEPPPITATVQVSTIPSITNIPGFYTPQNSISLLQYTTAVPEPKTWVLTLLGLFCIIYTLRRKNHGSHSTSHFTD